MLHVAAMSQPHLHVHIWLLPSVQSIHSVSSKNSGKSLRDLFSCLMTTSLASNSTLLHVDAYAIIQNPNAYQQFHVPEPWPLL